MIKQVSIPSANVAIMQAAVMGSVYPVPTISAPASGATGVSVTPTLTSSEGVASLYTLARRDTSNQTAVAVNTDLIFNAVSDNDIPLNTSTGVFTLKAGVEYELTGCPNLTTFDLPTSYAYFRWVFASDNSALPSGQSGSIIPSTFASNSGSQPVATATYRPIVDTDVKLRVWQGSGTSILAFANSWARVRTTAIKYIDYTQSASRFQVRLHSTGVVVFDSGEVVPLTATVSPALTATTLYDVRVMHKSVEGFWTKWSTWQSFTTA